MNRIKVSISLAAIIFAACATPSAHAQMEEERVVSTPSPAAPAVALPSVNRLVADIARAETSNNANDLIVAYGQAVREPRLAKGALSALLSDYYRLRALAGSAVQASQAVDETSLRMSIFQAAQNQIAIQQSQQAQDQNQKIIEQNETLIKQNERMIELLDQIARKK